MLTVCGHADGACVIADCQPDSDRVRGGQTGIGRAISFPSRAGARHRFYAEQYGDRAHRALKIVVSLGSCGERSLWNADRERTNFQRHRLIDWIDPSAACAQGEAAPDSELGWRFTGEPESGVECRKRNGDRCEQKRMLEEIGVEAAPRDLPDVIDARSL